MNILSNFGGIIGTGSLEGETRTKSDSSICEAGFMIQEEYIDQGSSYTDS